MTTIILNHQPYDGTDVTWNALRLAKTLVKSGEEVNIFLMNDAVDLARDKTSKPDSYDYDLVAMLKELYEKGTKLQVCGTCNARCGLFKNEPYFDEKVSSTMQILADWVIASDKVLTF
ncbi:MAG: sulfur reduction protein DsrE [Sulfurimonas sp. RIFOXYD12_FULL_33_39]|uniref:DsrE/DsrF/TusD sulfur relay family protein n=1 Tax=unclassified Sulfurimonas TaxID=2623549 RepID=UPI0008D3A2DE|nr:MULTISPECIES: DsrE family protein [unclassified Sulfurimonas]OHE05868.1 MAG: sulfur reduction protein DsrE [Sulfurimonas sp. RIFCSPLOWO2_12_FULL_34_6]OHE10217.1 MAG: sulfur reduction protein DsrE [Sulfurimonas sp. RIFOXYD12_FULL_33_39]OHE14562.1 MAG: sulfur reduction protein DsrE [Sulfurimonas sp. RIFOXYD2_FULL_34_21]DAB28326.1 MAG TPA: sulfur reduction protein DsrE [Sulfurimonas sp. UBA10385]